MVNQNEYSKQINEERIFKGKMFEVVEQTIETVKDGKEKTLRPREIARRAPGVRMLITRNQQIKLIQEYRIEIKGWDYRLPGGKVFDKLNDYLMYIHNPEKMSSFIEEAVIREAQEEAGILPKKYDLIYKSICGASVEWDLYYYEVSDFEDLDEGAQPEEGEIIYQTWKSYEEVRELCLNDEINEGRTVAVLLRYISSRLSSK